MQTKLDNIILPLLSFATLATHIKHPVHQSLVLESGLHDPCGFDPALNDILISWYIVSLE